MLRELHVTDLGIVEDVTILLDPGSTAITGETGAGKTLLVEAIELLLQSKRINPKGGGGGGGGDTPGGGGGTGEPDAAIALIGAGLNPQESREQRNVAQATGEAEQGFPEEFRAGLDEYFIRLEEKPADK